LARTEIEIDLDLKRACARRAAARERIAALSAAIVADTRQIDRLLAERMEVTVSAA
jgi:hypothetical protein